MKLDSSFNPIWTSLHKTSFTLHSIPVGWSTATPPVANAWAGPLTQVTSSPLLVIPTLGSGIAPYVLFLIYNPASGSCAGTSYTVQAFFDTGGLTTGTNNGSGTAGAGGTAAGAVNLGGSGFGIAVSSTSVTSVGTGASSGFTIAGNVIYVAKSGVGSGATPSFSNTNKKLTLGTQAVTPNWWIELQ